MSAPSPRTRKPTKKTTGRRAPKQPTDHQPPPPVTPLAEAPVLTEADFNLDTGVVLAMLGVDPGTVKADTTKIGLVDNKVLIEYAVIRAIPPRIMGLALLNGAQAAQEKAVGKDDG